MQTELLATWSDLGLAVVSTIAIFLAVITYTRIVGLRSFSKMSSFDFAMTVAVGSLMSAVGMGSSSLLTGLAVLATLYGVQVAIAFGRRRWSRFEGLVDNTPRLLMVGEELLEDAMRTARVTRSDVLAKLREANVTDLSQVHAVVLETTGDISVLHGTDDAPALDVVCEGVIGAGRLDRRG